MGKRTNTAVWSEKYSRWQINVQKDGKRRSFYSSTHGRAGQREANSKADAWLDDGVDSRRMRVEAAYDEYINRQKETTSRGHCEQYESFGKVWIKPIIGHIKLEKLNEDDMQLVIDKAYKAGKAHKTLCGIRTAMVSFMKYCRRRKLTVLCPEGLTIPRGAKKSEKVILQPNDIIKLFSSDEGTFNRHPVTEPLIHAFRFQVLTGLRPGELLGLEWSDIRGRDVSLKRSYNRYGETTTGKNDNAIRTFTMTESAYKELQAQRQINPFGRVFGDITQCAYKCAWNRYSAHNGLTKTTPYELRHTFVSIAKALPEGEIKSLVGHSRSMDTFGVYSHELAGERAQTAAALQAVFNDILLSEKDEVC